MTMSLPNLDGWINVILIICGAGFIGCLARIGILIYETFHRDKRQELMGQIEFRQFMREMKSRIVTIDDEVQQEKENKD